MEKCMEEIEEKIENIPDNTEMIKKIVDFIDKKEEEERNEEKMKEEEENMNRPLPNSFIAELK
jgi:arginine deiminase